MGCLCPSLYRRVVQHLFTTDLGLRSLIDDAENATLLCIGLKHRGMLTVRHAGSLQISSSTSSSTLYRTCPHILQHGSASGAFSLVTISHRTSPQIPRCRLMAVHLSPPRSAAGIAFVNPECQLHFRRKPKLPYCSTLACAVRPQHRQIVRESRTRSHPGPFDSFSMSSFKTA